MIRCSCGFFVRAHEYDGKELSAADPCPLCSVPLVETEPEAIQFIERRLGKTIEIDGSQFIFRDKIVLNRVDKYARENGIPKHIVMAAAKAYCGPCRKAQDEND
jgi:hypothetical protein